MVEAFAILTAVYFEPTYQVRGAIWREAFFERRPTSYWRDELERWNVQRRIMRRHSLEWCGSGPRVHLICYTRRPTWLETQRECWWPAPDESGFMLKRLKPSILHGDETALRVLRELQYDPSPRVRLLAQIGLGMNPEIPFDEDGSE
jgi:hypothetical protein